MGKLVTLQDVQSSAIWYFDDAYMDHYSGHSRYVFSWPNPSFPDHLFIHGDDLYMNNKLRIEIRKFVENNLSDTVIFDTVDKNYYKFFSEDRSWDRKYNISNNWYRFSFENSESAAMFALKFSEYIRPMTDWHPDNPEDEEWLKLPPGKRCWT